MIRRRRCLGLFPGLQITSSQLCSVFHMDVSFKIFFESGTCKVITVQIFQLGARNFGFAGFAHVNPLLPARAPYTCTRFPCEPCRVSLMITAEFVSSSQNKQYRMEGISKTNTCVGIQVFIAMTELREFLKTKRKIAIAEKAC